MKVQRSAPRTLLATTAFAAALLSATTVSVFAFTPGENGAPTGGHHTDLQGRAADVALTLRQDATIECSQLITAATVNLALDYEVQGAALPAESTVVVYVSPNDAAIDGNADTNNDGSVSSAEASAYVATVESNFTTVDAAGLSGSGTLTFSLDVTSPFQLLAGGVRGVVASDLHGSEPSVTFGTQSNVLNCLEAEGSPSPTPTASSSPSATPTPTSRPTDTPAPEPTPTAPAGGVPQPTPPDTAVGPTMNGSPGNGLARMGLVMLVIGSAAGVLLLMRPVRAEHEHRPS